MNKQTNYSLPPDIAREGLITALRNKGIKDEHTLDAFRKVPRHLFVSDTRAYEDVALPIGQGQTISQPYIVALMTELLELERGQDQKILEIGTGSGFQAAILAQFSRRVFTVERHAELHKRARALLKELGLVNVNMKHGDGTCGWPQYSPFDRIIVTAGAPAAPETLAGQLAAGGIMIIPAGGRGEQELMVYKKTEEGLESRSAGKVVFVPLIGQHGWKD
jgi:protein-L-isoaspartate(D-aspartate) O-methyltransferase